MADKRIVGLRSKESGAFFEDLISRSCEYYLQKGKAYIEKTPEPFHMVRRLPEGGVSGYYEKRAQPDYKGILSSGRGIMFEAKHTDTDRIRQAAVTQGQWEALDIYQTFGADCFVLVSMGFLAFYRVPWEVWTGMKERFGHKYMNAEDLKTYQIGFVSGVLRFLDDPNPGGAL